MAKSTETAECIARLDSLSTKYLEIDQQLDRSHDDLYDILRRVQIRTNKLENDPQLCKRVVKSIGKRKNRSLTLTLMTYIAKAKTKPERQKASKYARALEYLTQIKKTEPADIPKAIKAAGGIEGLARNAAKELPKTKRKAERSEAAGDGEAAGVAPKVETNPSHPKNRQTRRIVNLSISPDVNEELSELPLREEVKLVGRCVEGENDEIDLKITKVITMDDDPSSE